MGAYFNQGIIMADKKTKVRANVSVRDTSALTQRCWGVEFDVVELKEGFVLEAELSSDEAKAMKEAGRVE